MSCRPSFCIVQLKSVAERRTYFTFKCYCLKLPAGAFDHWITLKLGPLQENILPLSVQWNPVLNGQEWREYKEVEESS